LDWAEITISTTSEGIETITDILEQAGISGVSIYDRKDFEELLKQGEVWDYIDEALKADSQITRVCAYIPFNDDTENIIAGISGQLEAAAKDKAGLGNCQLSVARINDEDWAESWKKYYKPVYVGNRLIIKPTWESITDAQGRIIIEMDPGAAFGTGTHETTQLCLEMLEKHILPGDTVLDIGTGTGVLAIAAEKLGAKQVTAVDRDELALDAAKKNLENNRCGNWKVFKSDLLNNVTDKYSLIVANIVADPILSMVEELNRVMLNNARLILSGIILDRAQEVKTEYEHAGFDLIEKSTKNEWVSMVFRRGKE
jgi:ribosomal protein L11 methyltransferase